MAGSAVERNAAPDKARGLPEEQDDLSTYTGRTGAQIRKLRKARDWSRHEFVAKVVAKGYDLTEPALRSYENGNRPIPLNAIPAFAAALGVAVSTLMPRN